MGKLQFVIAGDIMDAPIKTSFVQEMREVLEKQLVDFELAKKKEEQDTKIVATEGAKTWSELKDSLRHHVEDINDGLRDGLWLLKNSRFVKIAEIWEIENVYQNGDRRL
jgi:hypothetical protein